MPVWPPKSPVFCSPPPQTGKTALIRTQLKPDYQFNLLESDSFLRLNRSPQFLRETVQKTHALVVIDEIQKIPALLDEVHWLLEERKAATTARFILFDLGVARVLRDGPLIEPRTVEWGKAFEAFIGHELRCCLDYRSGGVDALAFWRSSTHLEVDFIVGDQVAIEVKASNRITKDDIKGLSAI